MITNVENEAKIHNYLITCLIQISQNAVLWIYIIISVLCI